MPFIIGLITSALFFMIVLRIALLDHDESIKRHSAQMGTGKDDNLLMEILEQFYNQWKDREDRFWDYILKLFYATLLLIALPLLGSTISNSLQSWINENMSSYKTFSTVMICSFLVIGSLYAVRIASTKRTYDAMLKNVFKVERVTITDMINDKITGVKILDKCIKKFFHLPVNLVVVFALCFVLIAELYAISEMIEHNIKAPDSEKQIEITNQSSVDINVISSIEEKSFSPDCGR